MSSKLLKFTAATLAVAVALSTSVASAMPLAAGLAVKDDASAPVEQVRWGRGWGWGVGAGFVAGAVIGGALAPRYYYPGPYYYGPGPYVAYPADGDAVAYCMQRFKSYDPASGTYLGYDGLRHPCP
jgi:hypothetical protein